VERPLDLLVPRPDRRDGLPAPHRKEDEEEKKKKKKKKKNTAGRPAPSPRVGEVLAYRKRAPMGF
jgi:hypothetical protein